MKTKTTAIISELLTTAPHTRDNDVELYVCVLEKLGISGGIKDVLTQLDYASVKRERAMLQMKYPDLRGKAYKQRQRYSQVKREEYGLNFWDKVSRILYG